MNEWEKLHSLISQILGHSSGELLTAANYYTRFLALGTHTHTYASKQAPGIAGAVSQNAPALNYTLGSLQVSNAVTLSRCTVILSMPRTNDTHTHTAPLSFVLSRMPLMVAHSSCDNKNVFFPSRRCSGCRCHRNPHNGAEVPVTRAGVQAPLRAGDGGKCLILLFRSTLCPHGYCSPVNV